MSTIFCIGRNYAAHAREMGASAAPDEEPVVFLKPEHALLRPPGPIRLPPGAGEVQHEAELVCRVGPDLRPEALALGLDLTDRTRQAAAKARGLPWAAAKGFRGSAPLGPFVPLAQVPDARRILFTLQVNGLLRQAGDTSLMLHPLERLLAVLERWYGLTPGDLVFSGTPEGVGPIATGDRLRLEMVGVPAATAEFRVA